MGKQAIIIGAGPAGLTAAYEILKRTDIKPVILEKSGDIGGISKTINYKGNRMDIGGHRFFSKSERVMNWWLNIMPLQKTHEESVTINYQNKSHTISENMVRGAGVEEGPGLVMLVRKRLSRIYFLRKFFNYPIQLSLDTLKKLGVIRTIQIILSYSLAQVFKRKPEKSLEDFLINRFGKKLYLLFFKDYTEKVWGVPCKEISAEWGAQRIKGVSISKAIKHAAQAITKKKSKGNDIAQKDTETSLIEQFLYPALGPGQLWEEVARQIEVLGGKIIMNEDVKAINIGDNQVTSVITENSQTGEKTEHTGDYFFSTMPVQELIAGMNGDVPADVKEVAGGLQYRDFITVGVLLKNFGAINGKTGETKGLQLKDTWIYIQEKDVKVGRLQLFNNWSPFMVKEPDTVWLGMEYFCNKGDAFWSLSDEEVKRTAISELEKMGLAQVADVLDSTVHRVEKTYPAYFGTYTKFDKIRKYVDKFENLFLVGRNGMHKYNNSDHSMLTAMTAVDNICVGMTSKENLWNINTEQEYHEVKKESYKLAKPKAAETRPSFKDFLLYNRINKRNLLVAGIAVVLQFCIFKYFYPFASFINGDSYVYLQTASLNLDINTYPVGYSMFLRLFSVFSNSDTSLTFIQYILMQGSILILLYTLFYFYPSSSKLQFGLLFISIFNPIALYVCNYVSSDSLFISISFMWLISLLWILNRPTWKILLLQGLLLCVLFIIRYNAIYYPFITTVAFLLINKRIIFKICGVLAGIILMGAFIAYTADKYSDLTGTKQFSPFSGWQLANNALYAYRYVYDDQEHVPDRLRPLDNMVRAYFDSTKRKFSPLEVPGLSTAYMWDRRSPLQQYMYRDFKIDSQFQNDSIMGKLKRWAHVAPLYSKYGSYLVAHYPVAFLRYYLYLNSVNYFFPPVEFLGTYSTGVDTVKVIAQKWFRFKNNKVRTRLDSFNVNFLNFYTIIVCPLNIIFLSSFLGFLLLKGPKVNETLLKPLLLIFSLWLFNFLFSIIASPIALRFQLFPIMTFLLFTPLIIRNIAIKAIRGNAKNESFDLEMANPL
jgi:protoporphyrinogen oxidase